MLLTSFSLHAAIYDWEHEVVSQHTRKLRLNIPDSLETVRGILIHGNGAFGDVTGEATSNDNVKLAESLGFAVLATAKWSGFWGNEIELFEEQIAAFAEESGHPELVNCPWLPRGKSNGGQMAYGLNSLRPEKVIAFAVSKGRYYNTHEPTIAALRTPGLLIAGENDTQERRDSIKSLFTINRPRGALWAWIEEEDVGHWDTRDSKGLKLAFLMECCRLRYPRNQSTLDGPIKLKNLNEYDGWLVDQSTWKDGLTKIQPSWNYTGESRSLGWVPNERIARLYQGFSSYDKASSSVAGDTGFHNRTNITYSVDLTGKDWVKVEFYEGAEKTGEVLNNNTDSASITYAVSEERYHMNWGIVTLADGTQRATHFRRFFLDGGLISDPYTKWADENLALNERAEDFVLPSDTVTNLERFAFGLGLGPVDYSRLPNAKILRSSAATQFNFKVDEAAIEAGIIVTPQISRDLIHWTDIEVGVDINPQREGENVSMTLDHSFPTEFFQLKIQRSY